MNTQNQVVVAETFNVAFNDYEAFTIESTKMSDLPKIERFNVVERGVAGKKGEQCKGRHFVYVRINGEWYDLPRMCQDFKCKCGGQWGFTNKEKAYAFGAKALAKWGVESASKGGNSATAKLRELGYEYNKTTKKWEMRKIEHRK